MPPERVFHPVKEYPALVKELEVNAVEALVAWFDIEPLPPLLLKVTVWLGSAVVVKLRIGVLVLEPAELVAVNLK